MGEMYDCRSYWWKEEAGRPERIALIGMPCLSYLGSLSLTLLLALLFFYSPPHLLVGFQLETQH